MRPVLIMAGGRCQRIRAGGCGIHKALRRVGGLTLIERNMIGAFERDFKQMWIAVSAHEPALLAWINDEGSALAARNRAHLNVLVEELPLGTIGAASMLPREVDDVLVLNVDNLTDLDLRAFFEHHQQSRVAMSIASHQYLLQLPFGELVIEEGYLKAYVEKPSTSHLISSGIYVLGRRAIDQIPRETRMQVPELTEILCRRSLRILCYPHQAWWIDINDEQALATANEKLGLAMPTGAGSP